MLRAWLKTINKRSFKTKSHASFIKCRALDRKQLSQTLHALRKLKERKFWHRITYMTTARFHRKIYTRKNRNSVTRYSLSLPHDFGLGSDEIHQGYKEQKAIHFAWCEMLNQNSRSLLNTPSHCSTFILLILIPAFLRVVCNARNMKKPNTFISVLISLWEPMRMVYWSDICKDCDYG